MTPNKQSHTGRGKIAVYFYLFVYFLKQMFLLLILERGKGGERERETRTGCLLYAPQPGIKPIIQVCALTGERNCKAFGEQDEAPTN